MNIELSMFTASSSLMTAFEEPPSFAKKLRQNALIQAIRTKKHFRVLVGDAKNEKDFEIKILSESSENKWISHLQIWVILRLRVELNHNGY